jgi:hypothetical protein
MRKQFIISTGSAIALLVVCGCRTPPDADMSPGDAMVLAPFVVIGAIIVSPVYIADKTWELSLDGIKTHVYASPGTSLGDFKRAIDKAEGETCFGEYEPDHDNVMRFKYRGKKAVYYGRFVDGLAIKY